jgi:hypothetical protein
MSAAMSDEVDHLAGLDVPSSPRESTAPDTRGESSVA